MQILNVTGMSAEFDFNNEIFIILLPANSFNFIPQLNFA